MTRKYTDELIAELPSTLPDNSTGMITPALVRGVVTDTIQSLRPSFAGIGGDHIGAPIIVPLTNSGWSVINGIGLFASGGQSDAAELSTDQINGALIVKLDSFIHFFSCVLAFEGPNGRLLDLAIGVDGSPISPLGAIECLGNNTLQNFSVRMYSSPAANAAVHLLGKWYGGAATDALKVSFAQLIGELATTRYP